MSTTLEPTAPPHGDRLIATSEALDSMGLKNPAAEPQEDGAEPTHGLYADVSEAGSPFANDTITPPDENGRIFAETAAGRREVAWLASETDSGRLVFMDEVDWICQELAKKDRAEAAGLVPVASVPAEGVTVS